MKRKIPIIILIILLSGFFLISYLYEDNTNDQAEKIYINDKFSSIEENNVYDIINNNEVEEFLDNGTGILILGTYESIWMEDYLLFHNEVAKEQNVESIKFFDILPSKSTQSRTYETITKVLEDHLYQTDANINTLFTPMAIYMIEGDIILIDNETAIMKNNITPEEYWTNTRIESFKITISNNIIYMEGLKNGL